MFTDGTCDSPANEQLHDVTMPHCMHGRCCNIGCKVQALPVNDGHLDMAGRVSDDGEASHLRSCSGSCVDAHQGQHGLGDLVHPLIVRNTACNALLQPKMLLIAL